MARALAEIGRWCRSMMTFRLNALESARGQIARRLHRLMQIEKLQQPLQSLHTLAKQWAGRSIHRLSAPPGSGGRHAIEKQINRLTVIRSKFCVHDTSKIMPPDACGCSIPSAIQPPPNRWKALCLCGASKKTDASLP